MSDLAIELEQLSTAKTVAVTGWDYSERFDSLATLKLKVDNPYLFHHGDLSKFSFPVGANSSYLREFYGVVGERSLKDKTLVCYDYGALTQQLPAVFNSSYYIGTDPLLAIKDLIETEDDNSYIDTSLLHGSSPAKFITINDNIENNGNVWEASKKMLPVAIDTSNDWYALPYHIFWDGNKIRIDKRANIEDSSTYPSSYTLDNSDLWNITIREDDNNVANYVKCDGLNGATYTQEDLSSTTPYGSYDFPQKYQTINYASAQLDELQEQAVNHILLNRSLRSEYTIHPGDLSGIRLNNIITMTSDEFGIDGRFVVTGISFDSLMRMKVTLSGQQLAIADVL